MSPISFVPQNIDYVVIGLGINGASTLYHLAQKCHGKALSILGIDQGNAEAPNGGSKGHARITGRLTGSEFEAYFKTVPWSNKVFSKLAERGYNFYSPAPCVTVADRDNPGLKKILRQCAIQNISHEHIKDGNHQSLQGLNIANNDAVVEVVTETNKLGLLDPTILRNAFLSEATKEGAQTVFNQKVVSCTKTENCWLIELADGSKFMTKSLAVVNGIEKSPLEDYPKNIDPTRIPLVYLPLKENSELNASYLGLDEKGNINWFAMPELHNGVRCLKAGIHELSSLRDDNLSDEEFTCKVSDVLIPQLNKIFGEHLKPDETPITVICNYDNTSRGYPYIYKEKSDLNLVQAYGFCGNGAKHSGWVGEAIADTMIGIDHPLINSFSKVVE